MLLDRVHDQRLVTAAIWKAPVARDHHYRFPGCRGPTLMCHAHHVVHWIHGGPTSLVNLLLTVTGAELPAGSCPVQAVQHAQSGRRDTQPRSPSVIRKHSGRFAMEAKVNKQSAVDGYAAFSALDADAAMKNISDSVEWVVRGNSSVTGTYHGKTAVGELWTRFLEKGFRTRPTAFIAEGNTVVVICETELDGQQDGSVDVLSYDNEGELVRFETYGGEELLNRTFPR